MCKVGEICGQVVYRMVDNYSEMWIKLLISTASAAKTKDLCSFSSRMSYTDVSYTHLKNVLLTFLKAVPGILMPCIILGGIFSGKFTPSEAAAVAVVYAMLVSMIVYRDLPFKKLLEKMCIRDR